MYSTVLAPQNPPPIQATPPMIQYQSCYDDNYKAFVGWEHNAPFQGGYSAYFSPLNIQNLSQTIQKELLKRGFNMVVSQKTLSGVMSSVWRTNVPVRGDIYTLYNIPNLPAENNPQQLGVQENDVEQLNQRVVNIIVNTITDEQELTKANESLSAWTTVLGSFNQHGLRSHDIIKIKENDYKKNFFVINY